MAYHKQIPCIQATFLLSSWDMLIKQALEIIGGLSEPSKMPCYSYSFPAEKCITGMKLRKVKNSICSKCYCLKGNYGFPVVRKALARRFDSLSNPLWVEAMTVAIGRKEKSGFSRMHDSGDLQSVGHLANIVQIAKNLPRIQFWLPTREYGIVAEYLKTSVFPSNLIVRLSAYMIDGPAPTALANRLGLCTSGVSKGSFTCPAPNQDGKCLDCRACWSKGVANVNYKPH